MWPDSSVRLKFGKRQSATRTYYRKPRSKSQSLAHHFERIGLRSSFLCVRNVGKFTTCYDSQTNRIKTHSTK
ncbi:hypothetical protein BKA93DRAFT_769275 [Sparassis latifolia]